MNRQSATTSTLVLDDKAPDDVARAIIEGGRQTEPFYLVNLDEVYSRIQHFKKMMPRVQIFYAMKSNDSEVLLKLCVASGLGFDCASPGEINKIRRLNVPPSSIVYAMPTKTPAQMTFARESSITHTTFDTSCELKKLKVYWPEAKLLIRIRVDSDSVYKLGDKFGCDFETEAIALLEEAASFGLQVVGVAFHVGSVCFTVDAHAEGLRQARALFDHEARAGRTMSVLDIGGGFLSDRTDRINQVAELINSTLAELFPSPDIQVIAEPGRYLNDSAYTLYCNICNVRQMKKGDQLLNMLYLNDGYYGTLRFYESFHTVRKFMWSAERDTGKLVTTILWGPSCDSTDRIMSTIHIRLPPCGPLDWLIFPMQGGYTNCFSTQFSCLSTPLERSIISFDLWNKIKDAKVFKNNDFVLNADISTPLPKTMPAPISGSICYDYEELPKL